MSGHSIGLVTLDEQLASVAAALKEAGAQLEAIKATAAQAAAQTSNNDADLRRRLEEILDERERRERDLNRIITIAEASKLTSLSPDTVRRRFRDKLVELSERRLGLRYGDALMLNTNNNEKD